MKEIVSMAAAAKDARPVYAPLALGDGVRLPLGRGVDAMVVDLDPDHGAVICAWRLKSSYFERWFLIAHLRRA